MAILPVFDFLAVFAAGAFAWLVRFHPKIQALLPVLFEDSITFPHYAVLVSFAALCSVGTLALVGMYRVRLHTNQGEKVMRIAIACTITLAVGALAIFLRQELFGSRFLVLASWGLAILFLILERLLVGIVRRVVLKRGFGATKTLLIGADTITARLKEYLAENPVLGLVIVKELESPDIEATRKAVANPGVEAIVLADPNFPKEKVVELIDFAHEQHLSFAFVPNIFQTLTTNAVVEVFGDMPLIELRRTSLEGWGGAVKRVMDIGVATTLMVLSSPIMVLIAAAIKLDSSGPILYRDRRVGPRGEFDTLKFRSMYKEYCTGEGYGGVSAEQFERELIEKKNFRTGPVPKIANDPRRTRVGRIIEKLSMDELPQLYNVFLGHMSLVGPRPHRPKEVAHYQKHHKRVFAVPPGITGLAQISGRSDLDFEDEVRLDTYYIEHWSPWLDLTIMVKTPLTMFFRKHRS